jgi:hypothetical protein
LTEVQRFPETFNNIGARRPHDWLVVNTGLWICDFTRPWVEEDQQSPRGTPRQVRVAERFGVGNVGKGSAR